MSVRLTSLLGAIIFVLGSSTGAQAAWEEILSVRFPANGMYQTYNRYKSGKLKLTKTGPDCKYVSMSFTPFGRDQFNNRLILGLGQIGTTRDGSPVYQVNPFATVFEMDFRARSGRPDDDCTYTFYAEVFE